MDYGVGMRIKNILLVVVLLSVFGAQVLEAQRGRNRFKVDRAALSVGPLRINHRDGKFDPERVDKITYPGVFGRNHMFFVGRRSAGFGGSIGDLEIIIPSEGVTNIKTFSRMLGRRKGTLRIVNHLYRADPKKPRPTQVPIDGVFIDVDYRKTTKSGQRLSASLLKDSEGEKFAKGSIRYKLLAKKRFKRTGPFGERLETTRYQFEFDVRGFVKDLVIFTTPANSFNSTRSIREKARVKGKFRITFEQTIKIL